YERRRRALAVQCPSAGRSASTSSRVASSRGQISTELPQACGNAPELPAPSEKRFHRGVRFVCEHTFSYGCSGDNCPSRTRPLVHTRCVGRAWGFYSGLVAVQALDTASQTAPVPPQNLEAEESVLGAMMLSPGAIGAVSEVLDAGDFYRE